MAEETVDKFSCEVDPASINLPKTIPGMSFKHLKNGYCLSQSARTGTEGWIRGYAEEAGLGEGAGAPKTVAGRVEPLLSFLVMLMPRLRQRYQHVYIK